MLMIVAYHIYYHMMAPQLADYIGRGNDYFCAFNNLSWYVGDCFLILVFAKLFLNRILQGLSQKNYLVFLLTIFAIIQFGWSRGKLDGLISDLAIAFMEIFLYIPWEGYIRKYNPFAKLRTWSLLAVMIGLNVIVCVNYDTMSVSEREQTELVQSERRMLITIDFEEIVKHVVRIVIL